MLDTTHSPTLCPIRKCRCSGCVGGFGQHQSKAYQIVPTQWLRDIIYIRYTSRRPASLSAFAGRHVTFRLPALSQQKVAGNATAECEMLKDSLKSVTKTISMLRRPRSCMCAYALCACSAAVHDMSCCTASTLGVPLSTPVMGL
jgi:hypothetical protein